MNSILITGCNRGLGLGIVQHLVQLPNPPEKIFATCRDITKAQVIYLKLLNYHYLTLFNWFIARKLIIITFHSPRFT